MWLFRFLITSFLFGGGYSRFACSFGGYEYEGTTALHPTGREMIYSQPALWLFGNIQSDLAITPDVNIDTFVRKCPKKNRGRQYGHHKACGSEAGKEKESVNARTIHDICLEFFNDEGVGFANTAHQKKWFLAALGQFLSEQFEASPPKEMTEHFLKGLIQLTLKEYSREDSHSKEVPVGWEVHASEDFDQSSDGLLYFQQVMRAIKQVKESSPEKPYKLETVSFKGGGKLFTVRRLLSTNISAWIRGLLELLCITFDDTWSSREPEYFYPLLAALGVMSYPAFLESRLKVHRSTHKSVSSVESDILLRRMRDYYSDTRSNLVQMISAIEGVDIQAQSPGPEPEIAGGMMGLTLEGSGEVVEPQRVKTKPGGFRPKFPAATGASEPGNRGGADYRALAPDPVPEVDPMNDFVDAIHNDNEESARSIYSQNKSVLEGHKRWQKVKKQFIKLMQAKGFEPFLRKHRLL